MSADACMAIEGLFVWGVQRCHATAVTTAWSDGKEFPVCAHHSRVTT